MEFAINGLCHDRCCDNDLSGILLVEIDNRRMHFPRIGNRLIDHNHSLPPDRERPPVLAIQLLLSVHLPLLPKSKRVDRVDFDIEPVDQSIVENTYAAWRN